MSQPEVQGLVKGTTHEKVAGGGSVPTTRRYSLSTNAAPDAAPAAAAGPGAGKVLSSKAELRDALTAFQQSFCMVDATKPDMPIMFASEGFYQLTGYSPLETIGKNPRFLQGADTDRAEVAKLKQAIQAGESWCGRLLNYKKDGSPFWNLLTVTPVKDDGGKVVKLIGMLVEVTKYTEGSRDKETRPNALPVSLIKYDARQKEEAESSAADLLIEAQMQPLLVGEAAAKAGGEAEKEEQGKGEQQQQQQQGEKKTERRKSFMSALSMKGSSESVATEQPPAAAAAEKEETDVDRKNRKGMDLATTLERIQKNFVITDPRLPDNPIIFASDDFLELTEYSREEIIGRNCRFLQGPDTNPKTVQKIREAINNQEDITVQLLNYTKSGKPFWNLFHLQAVKDTKGMLQYFIGVQLDASQYLDPNIQGLEDRFAQEGEKIIVEAANNIDGAVRDLVDPGSDAKDIWAIHSVPAIVKPHKRLDAAWKAIQEVVAKDGRLGLKHFRPIKPLGAGDTGSVHLVELRDTGRLFAMKAMDKEVMINRNKVHRACTEREILGRLDHPFLPTLYASFQTATHVCLITEFCAGGELYGVLERQKGKRFPESVAKFFAAEVLLALEFLHTQGVVYRDLKPENVLLMDNGHALLSDFDLSFISTSTPKLEPPAPPPLDPKKQKKAKKALKKKKGPMSESERQLWKAELVSLMPMLVAEPSTSSNSFVGTEEYIAPEIINGTGHSSPVDWWAFGIFVHEMIFGRTPFRGRNRQRTFTNVLMKELTFPDTVPASPESKDLMRALLERDPERRLGSKKGAAEIRAHPFFADIDWALIRHKPPPSIPVPLKLLSTEAESTRVSLTGVPEDELEWEEHEARPSESMDYGY